MVEAGGQRIRGFRHGLDYAFIRWRQRASADAERLIGLEPDPSARPGAQAPRRVYESLQGRPGVRLLPTPRRRHAAVLRRRRQVSPM